MLKPESHNDARELRKNEGHSCGNADVTNSRRGGECKPIPSRGERWRKGDFNLISLTARSFFASETTEWADILNSRNATPPSPILVAFIRPPHPTALAMALRSLFPCPLLAVLTSCRHQNHGQKTCLFPPSLK